MTAHLDGKVGKRDHNGCVVGEARQADLPAEVWLNRERRLMSGRCAAAPTGCSGVLLAAPAQPQDAARACAAGAGLRSRAGPPPPPARLPRPRTL